MRKLQMTGHILVTHEAGLLRGAGQRGNQRIRKTMVAPRDYFETANGVIVKRQATRLNLTVGSEHREILQALRAKAHSAVGSCDSSSTKRCPSFTRRTLGSERQ